MKKIYNNWRVAIVASEFNESITKRLFHSCFLELRKAGIKSQNIKAVWVPGAYEIPFMAQKMAQSKKYKAVICLGCIIQGETSHDHHIATWASVGIGLASLKTNVPILFGVLTPKNEYQARQRSQGDELNRGKEVARAAIQMIQINQGKF